MAARAAKSNRCIDGPASELPTRTSPSAQFRGTPPKSAESERVEAPPIIVVSTAHYLTRAFEIGADEEPPGVYEDFDRTDRQIRLYQVTEGDAFELLSGENAIGAMYGGAERDGARWAVLLLPDTFEF